MNDMFELKVYIIFAVVAAIIGSVISNASCKAAWAQSGLATSWGPIQGCLVQTPSGRWLPEDRARETDLEPREPRK